MAVAQLLPQLLGHVGSERVQQLDDGLELGSGRAAVVVQGVDQSHELCNGGVHLQALDVSAHLLDGLVQQSLQLGTIALALHQLVGQSPHAVEEAVAAGDGRGLPGCGLLEVAHEHLVQTHSVGTVLVHDLVGVDDIAQRFGHLDDGVAGHLTVLFFQSLLGGLLAAVLLQQLLLLLSGQIDEAVGIQAQDHAVSGALLVGFRRRHDADVVQELMPETAVEQMQGGVLHAAVVPVHRRPVFQRLFGSEGVLAVGVHIAQEVPGRTGPLRHGVGLAGRGAAAAGAGGLDPVGVAGQRRLTVGTRLKVGDVGQGQRQAALGQGLPAALLALDHGDRLAPVALTAEHPVAELVVDLIPALAVGFQPLDHLFLGVGDRQAVEEAGVDQRTGGHVGEGSLVEVGGGIALDDLDDGQAKLFGELPVAGIVGRHGHDGAGAVGSQNVVGDEDGDLLVVDRVDAPDAFQLNAGLFLVQLTALEVALAGSLGLISLDGVGILDDALFQPLLEDGVLGRDDHVGSAEQGVAAGGVDGQGVTGGGAEVDLCAVAAADPVLLLGGDALDVIQTVQTVDELVRVGGDLQHPLALDAVDDLAAAALADAVDDFLVCQHALAAGTPVDVHFLLVGEALLVQLQEDPLGPLIILGVGGVDLTVPVEGEAQCLELLPEVVNIPLGDDGRMDVVLHGEVLGGQAESVPAHRVEHVITVLAALAAHDIQRSVAAGMADVQARARGIRELHQCIELGLLVVDLSVEGLLVLPHLLPLGLHGLVIILHFCNQLQTFSKTIPMIYDKLSNAVDNLSVSLRSTAPLSRGASGEEGKFTEMPKPPLVRGGGTA